MKRFIAGSVFFISVITLFLFSCSEGSCFEETESYLKATFYTSVDGITRAQAPDSISLNGLGIDTKIYKKAADVKVGLIPLNSSAESSKFILKINEITDTIEFIYSSYPHLISKECGYTYYHELESIIHSDTSITDLIKNRTITNLNVENIQIFY